MTAILPNQLLSVFYWAVCSEGSGVVLRGLSSAQKHDGRMQRGMEGIRVSSKSSRTQSRVWGLFFLHNMSSGREPLLGIPCSCSALSGTNKSSTWMILWSSFPPGCSYPAWWFSCRNNACLWVAFLISHKSPEEAEMDWDFKLLRFLEVWLWFGYPGFLTLVLWRELLLLMLAQVTRDNSVVRVTLENKCKVRILVSSTQAPLLLHVHLAKKTNQTYQQTDSQTNKNPTNQNPNKQPRNKPKPTKNPNKTKAKQTKPPKSANNIRDKWCIFVFWQEISSSSTPSRLELLYSELRTGILGLLGSTALSFWCFFSWLLCLCYSTHKITSLW